MRHHLRSEKQSSLDPISASALFWTFQPPKWWEVNFCSLKVTQPLVICYSGTNELTYPPAEAPDRWGLVRYLCEGAVLNSRDTGEVWTWRTLTHHCSNDSSTWALVLVEESSWDQISILNTNSTHNHHLLCWVTSGLRCPNGSGTWGFAFPYFWVPECS